MTSLGGHATCRSMDIDFLKTGIVEKVATPNKMDFYLAQNCAGQLV